MSNIKNSLSHSNVLLLKAKNKQEMFYNELLLSNPDFFQGSHERKSQTPGKQSSNKEGRQHLKSSMDHNSNAMGRKPPTTTKNKQINDIQQEMVINCLMNKKKKPLAQKTMLNKNLHMKIKSPTNYQSNRYQQPSCNNHLSRSINSKELTRCKMNTNTPLNNILSHTIKIKDMSNVNQTINKSNNTTFTHTKNKSDNGLFHSKQNSFVNLKDKENSISSNNMIKNSLKEDDGLEKREFKDVNSSPLLKSNNKDNKEEKPKNIREKNKGIDNIDKGNYLTNELLPGNNNTVNVLKKEKSTPCMLNNETKTKFLNYSSSVPDMLIGNPLPKKVISKIDTISKVGFSGPGFKKVNQDNYFIFKNLNDEPDTLYIGVCDGHGLVGHEVSKYLITHLPINVHEGLKATNKYISNKESRDKALKTAFVTTNEKLCNVKTIDTNFSGSTCVTIIVKKRKIISANAGDSRAVLGRCLSDGTWVGIDLSRDHKPNDPEELERILNKGGRIDSYKDEKGAPLGPPRVWLKKEDIPGLAMSRSFGDEVAASVGTISEPEIKEFNMTENDKFIIIASDGIWEFISSNECVNIVKDYYLKNDISSCLTYLLNESSKRWIKEEEVIDDITCLLVFFEK